MKKKVPELLNSFTGIEFNLVVSRNTLVQFDMRNGNTTQFKC